MKEMDTRCSNDREREGTRGREGGFVKKKRCVFPQLICRGNNQLQRAAASFCNCGV